MYYRAMVFAFPAVFIFHSGIFNPLYFGTLIGLYFTLTACVQLHTM
eukprot:SAG11_NODE_28259_length_323_cov_2.040179_1_plen_45_part_10